MHFLIECTPLFAGPLVLITLIVARSIWIKRIGLIFIPLVVACIANQLSGEGPHLLGMDVLKAYLSTAVVLLLVHSIQRFCRW